MMSSNMMAHDNVAGMLTDFIWFLLNILLLSEFYTLNQIVDHHLTTVHYTFVEDIFHPQGRTVGSAQGYFLSSVYGYG